LNEDHCRVLGAFSRPELEIELSHCEITSAGTTALVKVLGRNQGPTTLDFCDMDIFVLANGLRGNNRLKSVRSLCFPGGRDGINRQVLAIAGALRENRGLVDLDLRYGYPVNNETWGAICNSLKTHPALEVLTLRSIFLTDSTTTPAVLKSQIQVLLDMMTMNISIQMIELPRYYSEHELFRKSVIPYLETNRFRPRVRAIQRSYPLAYRAKVLGRALLTARTDPNRFWMILTGNAEIAFPSTTANLPTPATATSNSTAISLLTDNIRSFLMKLRRYN
jgi:hypothetical protein